MHLEIAPRPAAGQRPATGRERRKRPAGPPRLRTLLLLSNLAVLALPLTALWAMRLYERALVRQTESELVAQGAVLAAAFREQLRRGEHGEVLPVAQSPFPPTEAALTLAGRPGLDRPSTRCCLLRPLRCLRRSPRNRRRSRWGRPWRRCCTTPRR